MSWFQKLMGGTDAKSTTSPELNADQQALLSTGARSVGAAMPGIVNNISAGSSNGRSTFDSVGAANVINAMKQNNQALAARQRANNDQALQRTSLGKYAANAQVMEGLARNQAGADQYGLNMQMGAEEAARAREVQWSNLLASLYGSSLGKTQSTETGLVKRAGLGEGLAATNSAISAGGSLAAMM